MIALAGFLTVIFTHAGRRNFSLSATITSYILRIGLAVVYVDGRKLEFFISHKRAEHRTKQGGEGLDTYG